jgi:hypothetical protein
MLEMRAVFSREFIQEINESQVAIGKGVRTNTTKVLLKKQEATLAIRHTTMGKSISTKRMEREGLYTL